ncbi:hypothetical protein V6N12_038103 [Hibiscus sabdariffa]|uniref:Uncharacterized protein n=1 Tax=Hibiscus sabdariffa TaxID=183260 RepID=A0ABR2BWK5_9ROSI
MKWLQGFDHNICADVLYPSSSTVVAPCITSTTPPTPPLGRVPHILVLANVACDTSATAPESGASQAMSSR